MRAALLALAAAFAATAAPATAAAQPKLLLGPVIAAAESEREAAAELTAAIAEELAADEDLAAEAIPATPDASRVDAERVRAWSQASNGAPVLVGEVDSGAARIALRSGHSGGVIDSWEIGRALDPGEIERALASVRIAVLRPATPAVSSEPAAAEGDVEPAGLRTDEPISIRSEQLDVVSREGRRHLVFRDHVVVRQGDVELRANQLDAFYAAGDSQPERLVARGAVEVAQGERVAHCDEAIYEREQNSIVCTGRAELVQGCDVVRGERLEFDLAREHFRVTGAASVELGGEGEACPARSPEAGNPS